MDLEPIKEEINIQPIEQVDWGYHCIKYQTFYYNEKTGELIAVAVSGLRKDKTEAVNFGIKTNSLKNFLEANQIKTSGSKMLFSFGDADVSNILEESTVYTFCK